MMKLRAIIRKFFPVCLVLAIGCIEPYTPEVSSSSQEILVIDSFFNTNGESEIKLTLSQSIYETDEPKAVTSATVQVEGSNGTRYSFVESSPGTYITSQKNLSLNVNYRLLVTTFDNKTYASPFVLASPSPEIDSLTWEVTKDNGVQIYANSRDIENKTKRYLWKYTETWLYTSAFQSSYYWSNGSIIAREQDDDIYRCYQTEYSTKILYSTTESLAQDIVSKFLVTSIPEKSERISNKYSILVTQFGLTQEGLDYWTQLKKNTENLGTLFDPQPSIITGNIQNVKDPNEVVLGFFSAGVSSEKRIFIPVEELTRLSFLNYETIYKDCSSTLLETFLIPTWRGSSFETVIGPVYSTPIGGPPQLLGYAKAPKECVDCRRKNGTNVKPSFWQ
jgi:hypothetical protein